MPALPLPLLTPSLRLRHFKPDDTAAIMALNAEPTTGHWLPSHVYADRVEADAAMSYLIGCCTTPGDPRVAPYVLALDELSSGALIGHVGFSPLDGEVEVSYAVAEARRGGGLGLEAVVAACRWAINSFELDGVLALTAAANEPSRRLLARAGFSLKHEEQRRFQGSLASVSVYRMSRSQR